MGTVERAMGDVDERAAGHPSCPKCRSREINKLAKRLTVQLWQCGKCLDEFTTPLSPAEAAAEAAAAPLLPPPPERPTEEEVLKMSSKGGKCGQCGKPFASAAWREKHEARCGGEAKSAPSARAKSVAARIRRDRGLPAAAPAKRAGHVLLAIEDLKAKRAELSLGIERIDELLPRLEKFAEEMGGGGS